MNKLYFGDNLHILREHIKDETVDLIYLDPPINSKREQPSRGATEYSQPRVERSGTLGSQRQIEF